MSINKRKPVFASDLQNTVQYPRSLRQNHYTAAICGTAVLPKSPLGETTYPHLCRAARADHAFSTCARINRTWFHDTQSGEA